MMAVTMRECDAQKALAQLANCETYLDLPDVLESVVGLDDGYQEVERLLAWLRLYSSVSAWPVFVIH